MPEVVLRFQVELHFSFRRCPPQIVLPLRQMSVEECAEPSRRSELQGPVFTGLCFEAPAREVVGTRRNHYSPSHLERRYERLSVRIPVEFEAVARFETDVDRRHEIVPAFHNSPRVRVTLVAVLEEFLPCPTERSILRGPRLIVAAGGRAPHAGPRQETEQRFERVPELIDARSAVPQVVRIVDLESPADFTALAYYVALRRSTPPTEQQVLVSTKLRRAPNAIYPNQCVSPVAGRVAIRKDRADSQVLIEVVRNSPSQQIGT